MKTLRMCRWYFSGWELLLLALVGCGSATPLPADAAVVAQESDEQGACVELYKPDTAKIDACRAQVKAKYDAYWRTHFMPDGGAK